MLIGVTAYFILFFGVGNMEVFYIIDLDKGIKKYVTYKPRKQHLEISLSEFAADFREFIKKRKGQLEDLKTKNFDRATPDKWYQDFFHQTMKERKLLQENFITKRLEIQEMITDDEWSKIMKMTSEDVAKLAAKKEKKRKKNEDRDEFKNLSNTLKETISDKGKLTNALKSLSDFEIVYKEINRAYENIHVVETGFLIDKKATREEMEKYCEALNLMRKNMYETYFELLKSLKNNSESNEWKAIVKDFNKM